MNSDLLLQHALNRQTHDNPANVSLRADVMQSLAGQYNNLVTTDMLSALDHTIHGEFERLSENHFYSHYKLCVYFLSLNLVSLRPKTILIDDNQYNSHNNHDDIDDLDGLDGFAEPKPQNENNPYISLVPFLHSTPLVTSKKSQSPSTNILDELLSGLSLLDTNMIETPHFNDTAHDFLRTSYHNPKVAKFFAQNLPNFPTLQELNTNSDKSGASDENTTLFDLTNIMQLQYFNQNTVAVSTHYKKYISLEKQAENNEFHFQIIDEPLTLQDIHDLILTATFGSPLLFLLSIFHLTKLITTTPSLLNDLKIKNNTNFHQIPILFSTKALCKAVLQIISSYYAFQSGTLNISTVINNYKQFPIVLDLITSNVPLPLLNMNKLGETLFSDTIEPVKRCEKVNYILQALYPLNYENNKLQQFPSILSQLSSDVLNINDLYTLQGILVEYYVKKQNLDETVLTRYKTIPSLFSTSLYGINVDWVSVADQFSFSNLTNTQTDPRLDTSIISLQSYNLLFLLKLAAVRYNSTLYTELAALGRSDVPDVKNTLLPLHTHDSQTPQNKAVIDPVMLDFTSVQSVTALFDDIYRQLSTIKVTEENKLGDKKAVLQKLLTKIKLIPNFQQLSGEDYFQMVTILSKILCFHNFQTSATQNKMKESDTPDLTISTYPALADASTFNFIDLDLMTFASSGGSINTPILTPFNHFVKYQSISYQYFYSFLVHLYSFIKYYNDIFYSIILSTTPQTTTPKAKCGGFNAFWVENDSVFKLFVNYNGIILLNHQEYLEFVSKCPENRHTNGNRAVSQHISCSHVLIPSTIPLALNTQAFLANKHIYPTNMNLLTLSNIMIKFISPQLALTTLLSHNNTTTSSNDSLHNNTPLSSVLVSKQDEDTKHVKLFTLFEVIITSISTIYSGIVSYLAETHPVQDRVYFEAKLHQNAQKSQNNTLQQLIYFNLYQIELFYFAQMTNTLSNYKVLTPGQLMVRYNDMFSLNYNNNSPNNHINSSRIQQYGAQVKAAVNNIYHVYMEYFITYHVLSLFLCSNGTGKQNTNLFYLLFPRNTPNTSHAPTINYDELKTLLFSAYFDDDHLSQKHPIISTKLNSMYITHLVGSSAQVSPPMYYIHSILPYNIIVDVYEQGRITSTDRFASLISLDASVASTAPPLPIGSPFALFQHLSASTTPSLLNDKIDFSAYFMALSDVNHIRTNVFNGNKLIEFDNPSIFQYYLKRYDLLMEKVCEYYISQYNTNIVDNNKSSLFDLYYNIYNKIIELLNELSPMYSKSTSSGDENDIDLEPTKTRWDQEYRQLRRDLTIKHRVIVNDIKKYNAPLYDLYFGANVHTASILIPEQFFNDILHEDDSHDDSEESDEAIIFEKTIVKSCLVYANNIILYTNSMKTLELIRTNADAWMSCAMFWAKRPGESQQSSAIDKILKFTTLHEKLKEIDEIIYSNVVEEEDSSTDEGPITKKVTYDPPFKIPEVVNLGDIISDDNNEVISPQFDRFHSIECPETVVKQESYYDPETAPDITRLSNHIPRTSSIPSLSRTVSTTSKTSKSKHEKSCSRSFLALQQLNLDDVHCLSSDNNTNIIPLVDDGPIFVKSPSTHLTTFDFTVDDAVAEAEDKQQPHNQHIFANPTMEQQKNGCCVIQ